MTVGGWVGRGGTWVSIAELWLRRIGSDHPLAHSTSNGHGGTHQVMHGWMCGGRATTYLWCKCMLQE